MNELFWANVLRTPFVFVRAPLMIIGVVLQTAGNILYDLGDQVPGWKL